MRITKGSVNVTVRGVKVRPAAKPKAPANVETARAKRAAALRIAESASVIELMADDANEKVRRVRVLDPVERAFRNEQISEEHYRLARCVERSVAALEASGGGLRLERVREDGRKERDGMRDRFVLMPRAPGPSRNAPQLRREAALDALARVEAAIGPGLAYSVLRAWAGEGRALYELDARWRRRRGWALSMVQFALGRMADAQVYEREKWGIDVLAEAA